MLLSPDADLTVMMFLSSTVTDRKDNRMIIFSAILNFKNAQTKNINIQILGNPFLNHDLFNNLT
jgi:hypothetical protein